MTQLHAYLENLHQVLEQAAFVLAVHISVERVAENGAFYRYRIQIAGDMLLEASERFEVVEGQLNFLKYSFHWQDKDGRLIARWDDAPHHPEIETFPYHVHEGSEENVQPHGPVTAMAVLRLIEERLAAV